MKRLHIDRFISRLEKEDNPADYRRFNTGEKIARYGRLVVATTVGRNRLIFAHKTTEEAATFFESWVEDMDRVTTVEGAAK